MNITRSIILTLIILASKEIHATPPELIVSVNKIRNTKGVCRVFLFNSTKGFPYKPDKAACKVIKITGDTIKIAFENITQGTYAIALFHDENNDGKLNADLFGVPKEGIGVSRNLKHEFSKPDFENAKFTIDKTGLTVSININYL